MRARGSSPCPTVRVMEPRLPCPDSRWSGSVQQAVNEWSSNPAADISVNNFAQQSRTTGMDERNESRTYLFRAALMTASMWSRYFSNARRPATLSRYSVRGMRPVNVFSHRHVRRLFEPARVHAQVAVRRPGDRFQVGERQRLAGGKRRQDGEPCPIVDDPVEPLRQGPRLPHARVRPPVHGSPSPSLPRHSRA